MLSNVEAKALRHIEKHVSESDSVRVNERRGEEPGEGGRSSPLDSGYVRKRKNSRKNSAPFEK